MDPQTFLDTFATIAEAQGGVQRLRELVLDLAVRGQLVHQDPADGPAAVLLDGMPTLQDSLVARGAVGKPRHPEGVAVDDPPHEIPASWAWARLGDVAAVVGGGTPKSGESAYWADGPDIPWLTPADMRSQASRFVSRGARDITARGLAESSAQLLPAGSVLFSSRAPIGHVGIANQPLATNQGFKSCVPYLGAMTEYLYLFLKYIGPIVDASATGTTFKEVSGKQVALIPVPVPPLVEQERIVAKVDELMELCDDLDARQDRRHRATTVFRASALHALTDAETPDDLRHAWARTHANWPALTAESETTQEIRETVLDLAVMGRLVDQRQSDGDADAEVDQARQAKSSIPGLRRQPAIARAHSTGPLPAGWVWAAVDDLFLVTGGIQKSSKRRPKTHHFPYLRVANVQRGRLDLREIERFELVDGELERLRLEPGDLLVVEGNGSESEIGRCARWNGEIADCVHQNHLIRCRPMLPGLEHYLLMFLNSPTGMATMKRLAVTTSGLYNLSVGKIRAIRFPLPPMAEQVRIREKVDSLQQKVQDLEDSLKERDSVREAFARAAVAALWVDQPDRASVDAASGSARATDTDPPHSRKPHQSAR